MPSFPFIGAKVDAIHHYRSEIVRYTSDIERDQRCPERFPSLNSAFVHFNHRLSIPLAVLTLKTRSPPSWTVKRGTAHDDIIWPNLAISWWEQCIRASIVYFLLVVLVLRFALPVTITGVFSQIAYLIGVILALASVERLPNWILRIIQGVLPLMILMLLTVMVPPALRVLANLQGLYSR
jgi:calcium permeable stress-gated cation channel